MPKISFSCGSHMQPSQIWLGCLFFCHFLIFAVLRKIYPIFVALLWHFPKMGVFRLTFCGTFVALFRMNILSVFRIEYICVNKLLVNIFRFFKAPCKTFISVFHIRLIFFSQMLFKIEFIIVFCLNISWGVSEKLLCQRIADFANFKICSNCLSQIIERKVL